MQKIWGADLQPAGCPACREAFLIEAARLGQPCPNCARGALASQPALLRPEPPEMILPFAKPRAELGSLFENFVKDVWIRPDDFEPQTLLKRAVPVFWPMWLVDGEVAGTWQAEMGYDYQVESAQESYAGGGWSSRKVLETRIRWAPRAGQISRFYHNVVVPALDEQDKLLSLIGPAAWTHAKAYDAEQLRGAVVRVPDLPPESAWPLARERFDQVAAQDCQTAAGAQHARQFNLRAAYEKRHWTQILLPLYATYYTDDEGRAQPVLVNGATGQMGGRRLASQRKGQKYAALLSGLSALAFLFSLLMFAVGMLLPPVFVLGVLAILGAFALGLAALAPLVWPWQWNRRQSEQKVYQK